MIFYNLNLLMSVSSLKYHWVGLNSLIWEIYKPASLPIPYPAFYTYLFMSLMLCPFLPHWLEKRSPYCLVLVHPSTLDSCVILSGKPASPHPDRVSCPCSVGTEASTRIWDVKTVCQKKSYNIHKVQDRLHISGHLSSSE